MHNQKDRLQTGAQWLRRHWVVLAAGAFAAILLLAGQPLLAADAQPSFNQTVPAPTPKPSVPNPGNDDNDNDSSSDDPAPAPAVTDAASAPVDVAQTVNPTATLTAVVDVLTLNVRQGPGTTFPVIGKLAQGAEVTVVGRNTAGDWWLVCCIAGTETSGWVSAALILPSFSTEQGAALPMSDSTVAAEPLAAATTVTATVAAATPVPGSKPGVVAGVNLNVRQGPGTENPVVGKLRAADAVSVLGRNAAGDWLYICCVGNPPANGWVSAQFITPAFAAADLEEVAGAPSTAPTPAPAADTVGNSATTTGTTGTGGLSVAIAQEPPFAVQGREIALVYTVRNDGSTELNSVVLSSELPGPLTLVGATAAGGAVSQQEPALVEITWPALAAGESATATVRVRVAENVPNGTTFANLATVTAGGESAVNGITIGMPPALLPEFW